MDICYHFVREFVLDGFLKVVFVKTEDNDVDIFIKNLKGELYLVKYFKHDDNHDIFTYSPPGKTITAHMLF